MAIIVKSGLYISISTSAPTNVRETSIALWNFPTKSCSMVFASFESAEIYSDVFSSENA